MESTQEYTSFSAVARLVVFLELKWQPLAWPLARLVTGPHSLYKINLKIKLLLNSQIGTEMK